MFTSSSSSSASLSSSAKLPPKLSPMRILVAYALVVGTLYIGTYCALMVNEFGISALDMSKLYYRVNSATFNSTVTEMFTALYNVLSSTAIGILLYNVLDSYTQRKDERLLTQLSGYISTWEAASNTRSERHINNLLVRKVQLPASVQYLSNT